MDLNFLTTLVGSFPHHDGAEISRHILANTDIPAWPQLPRRDFRESIYAQYCASLPGIVIDPKTEKIHFDTSLNLSGALEQFYAAYLADDVDAFALQPQFAAGFFAMQAALQQTPGEWAKGQVFGPVSFGLTVTDENHRCSLYDETLADVIVKNMVMHARWQVRQLQMVRSNVIIFVDEPNLAAFGSAFMTASREQVIASIDEVIAAIHSEGALAGVHCCGNTDWSVLMDTQVDVLNLDARGYLENLSLYPRELHRFLDRGCAVAWGIVPNDEQALATSPQAIAGQMLAGLDLIARRAQGQGIDLPRSAFLHQSLLTPSCGLGSTTPAVAGRVLELLAPTRDEILGRI